MDRRIKISTIITIIGFIAGILLLYLAIGDEIIYGEDITLLRFFMHMQ